jgi:hypothetical protein
MDAQQLMDRLEERAAEIPVGPPPIGLMRTRARRQRQGRMAVLASAAAVAAIAAGLAWQGTGGADGGSGTPIASEGPSDPDLPPDGYQYVGVGDLVAAVPQSWTRNETNCGTPTVDTVIIDPGPTCLMLVPRPVDVDSLTINPGLVDFDTNGYAEVAVGDEVALRSPIRRLDDGTFWQSVILPDADVSFVAESSSADGKAVVGDLLDHLTVLREHTTVPGFQDLGLEPGSGRMVDAYVRRLRDLGLQAEVSTGKGGGLDAGTVLEVAPAVGSVVAPGDTIRVVAAR